MASIITNTICAHVGVATSKQDNRSKVVSSLQTSSSQSIKAFTGFHTNTLVTKTAKNVRVSNGTNITSAQMRVWTPLNNKYFETFSFLPPLSDGEIMMQVDYIIRTNATPCIEFAVPDCAFTDDHGKSDIDSSAFSGYYDNRYWTMWKLPMFGCNDAGQVLTEIQECALAFPNAYIRIIGFDSIRQVQIFSMLVHRPPSDPALPTVERSV